MERKTTRRTVIITVPPELSELIPSSGWMSDRDAMARDDSYLLHLEAELVVDGHEARSFSVGDVVESRTDGEYALTARIRPHLDVLGSDACTVLCTLSRLANGAGVEETIAIANDSDDEFEIESFRWRIQVKAEAENIHWQAIPFLSHEARPTSTVVHPGTGDLPKSEGALLYSGQRGIAIARKPEDLPPRLIEIGMDAAGVVTIGAAAMDTHNAALRVKPRERVNLGTTAYLPFAGGVEQGFIQYRDYMSDHGATTPDRYDPPINYCVFYECGDYYQYQTLLEEMEYAQALGCTMLYLDQGWEDYAGSGLWDTTRLGRVADFIQVARQRELDVGLLVKLHGRAFCWDRSLTRQDRDGNILPGDRWGIGNLVGLCPSSPDWKREKTTRLASLVESGVSFFSFDFNDFQPELACCNPTHDHTIPMTEWEHVRHVATQQEMTKCACPGVLVEAHDWQSAGEYKYPVYLFGKSHDERWGFEYMWHPLEDFKSGRLHNLYYYNLAYEKPLYLHVDLTSDNDHGVVFWYIASTVRHFGVGNYAALTDARKQMSADWMRIYKQYREFFSRGIFGGRGPCVHWHTIPSEGTVILLFNDSGQPTTVSVELSHHDLGLRRGHLTMETLYGDMCHEESDDNLVLWQRLEPYSVSIAFIR